MKPFDHEKLLKELLPDERLADFRAASLERGLASLRQRRRQRLLFHSGALLAVACLIAGSLLVAHLNEDIKDVAVISSAPSPPKPDHVKFINDDELLAMFPQGSVALIGKPGQQHLVFLGAVERNTPVRGPLKD